MFCFVGIPVNRDVKAADSSVAPDLGWPAGLGHNGGRSVVY
jgi:hypothetical protein